MYMEDSAWFSFCGSSNTLTLTLDSRNTLEERNENDNAVTLEDVSVEGDFCDCKLHVIPL